MEQGQIVQCRDLSIRVRLVTQDDVPWEPLVEEVTVRLRERLADESIPITVERVVSLPKGPNGKVKAVVVEH